MEGALDGERDWEIMGGMDTCGRDGRKQPWGMAGRTEGGGRDGGGKKGWRGGKEQGRHGVH